MLCIDMIREILLEHSPYQTISALEPFTLLLCSCHRLSWLLLLSTRCRYILLKYISKKLLRVVMIGRVLILLTRWNLLLLLTHLIILTKECLIAFCSKKQIQTCKAKNTPKSMLYLAHITYMRSIFFGRVIQIFNLFSSWFTKTRAIYILNILCGIPFRHSAAIITAIVLS